MHYLDWMIVGGFVVFALVIGVAMTGKASQSTRDFFVAGRTLPWWAAGTSLVATSFSADTPLFVAGLVRSEGVFGNWFWWAGVFATVATVFFFARLWRRLDILTDLEFLAVRYEPSWACSALRIFRVGYDGLLINCIIMATVTVAATKITATMLGLSDAAVIQMPLIGGVAPATLVMLTLGLVALVYTSLSGLYGVVYTDLVQFALAMIGSITLAVVAFTAAARQGPVMDQLAALPAFDLKQTSMFPPSGSDGLIMLTFFAYVFVSWWGGAPGSGFAIQRLLATRSERDSMLAFLWYGVCHFVLRPWPWIVVGLVSMIYFPNLADPESAYPLMIERFLPIGIRGMMVAAMLAAFMSTLDTHLNLGASYLVNDLYKPYLRPGRSERHYVKASRVAILLLTAAMLIVTSQISGILTAYKYLGVIGGGVGLVMIARWFWWRVSVWSEISAMFCSLVVGNAVSILLPDLVTEDGATLSYFAPRLLINLLACTITWVLVTVIARPAITPHLKSFYRTSGVSGVGWRRVAQTVDGAPSETGFAFLLWGWAMGCIFLLGMLLGIGEIIFVHPVAASMYLGAAGVAGAFLITVFSKCWSVQESSRS